MRNECKRAGAATWLVVSVGILGGGCDREAADQNLDQLENTKDEVVREAKEQAARAEAEVERLRDELPAIKEKAKEELAEARDEAKDAIVKVRDEAKEALERAGDEVREETHDAREALDEN